IPRQLWMLAQSAAAAPAASTLRRRFLLWLLRGDPAILELLLVEQPHPLRLSLRLLLFPRKLAIALRSADALRRPQLLQSNQHLFAQPAIHGNQIGDQADEHGLES